jgi:hypothetical protein
VQSGLRDGANHPPRPGIFLARRARLTRMAWKLERLIKELDLLSSRGLPREQFFAELSPRLRNVIDNDASCWHTLDPSTRLLTSDAPKELIERGVFAADEAPAAGELIVRSWSRMPTGIRRAARPAKVLTSSTS